MRTFILLVLFAAQAIAGSIRIFGDTADTQVHHGGIFSGDPGQNQGQNGVNGGFDYSMVFVVQLPALAPGQFISAADFSFYDVASGTTFNTDLYGLAWRATPTVLASDWYTGTGDPNNTLIQPGIVPPSFTDVGRFTTSLAADATLLSFLDAQYTNGAAGGDYVFFRLSTNSTNPQNGFVNFYYTADVAFFLANAFGQDTLPRWQNTYSPFLDVTIDTTPTPEPGTAVGLLAGLLVPAAIRRRATA